MYSLYILTEKMHSSYGASMRESIVNIEIIDIECLINQG